MFIFLVSCLFYFAFIFLRALLLVSFPSFPSFPSIFFLPHMFPISFSFSLVYTIMFPGSLPWFFVFVFSSYASQTFYFISFLLFKFSFLVHIRFLFISCILCVFSYFPHVLVFSGSCVQNWTLCLCFDINSMFGVFVF